MPVRFAQSLAALVITLGTGIGVLAQLPDVPELSGVEVDALVVLQPGSNILRYDYRLRHTGSGSDLPVQEFRIDAASDPSRVSANFDGIEFGQEVFTFQESTQLALSLLGADGIVAVAAVEAPEEWFAGINTEGELHFSCLCDDELSPGETVVFQSVSRGLPAIRSALVIPDLFELLPNFDGLGITFEEYQAEVRNSDQRVLTIGPLPPPKNLDFAAFAAEIAGLRNEAEQNGWVRSGTGIAEMDSLLVEVQAALQSENFATARTQAAAFIAQVESISCTSFDCPAETPLTAEARALLAINMEFLRSQLPANEPPVADAGPDQVVECASAGATTVMLDGSGSTDPDGDALAYQWSGPFGIATGPKPTVILPLGTSEVGLVVNDGEFDSAPDTVSIVSAVRVEGLAPPLSALVKDSEPTPVPDQALKQGRTAPLKLNLFCGADQLTDAEVAPPDLISVERDGDALDLATLDLDSGEANDSGTAFRSSEGQWVYNLSTLDLATGNYRVTIEMPDGLRYVAGFVLR